MSTNTIKTVSAPLAVLCRRPPARALPVIVAILLSAVFASPALALSGPRWVVTVVAGPHSFASPSPVNEVQDVSVTAAGGTFTLSYNGSRTSALAYNADPATVQSALDALQSIGGPGGSVTVTGGPGSYAVTFGGNLGALGLPAMTADESQLTNGGSAASVSVSIATEGVESGEYIVTATNVGDQPTSGEVTIADTLPAGAQATVVHDTNLDRGFGEGFAQGALDCPSLSSPVMCTYSGEVDPGDTLRLGVDVNVSAANGSQLADQATVSGGGANSASASESMTVGAPEPPAGVDSFFAAESTAQAGGHPNFTTSFTLNQGAAGTPVASPRDISVDLPPGLVGDPLATPRCNVSDVRNGQCPEDTAVGVATTVTSVYEYITLVYNVAPYPDEPAAFAFALVNGRAAVRLDTSVVPNSGGRYAIHTSVSQISQAAPVLGSSVTLWGVPAEFNGPGPGTANGNGGGVIPTFGGPGAGPAVPFMTNPTDCSDPQTTAFSTDSWSSPGALTGNGTPDLSDPNWSTATSTLAAPTGCDQLVFSPSMSLALDTSSPDSPAGVRFDLSVPQNNDPNGLATPALDNATVTLPAGLVVSPSAADGLEGCSDQQIDLASIAPGSCPLASQIGTIQIKTPLLPDPLEGQIYLGTPNCNPCTNTDAQDGNMLRGFIQAQADGVLLKLPGYFTADPLTGQLTAHFQNNPQMPFSDLQLGFKPGPRAPVATPDTCGTFTTTADFSPWSAPDTPDATPTSSFDITGCGNPDTFSPSFAAGTVNPQAGSYSPFTLSFSRQDSDQIFSGLTATLPPGMLAKLAGVPLCSDADASAGTCPSASQVGTASVASGPGSEPLWIPQPGEPQPGVYLTGPYKGAPYGLAVQVPAIAGPFNLGVVTVRQALYVDPTDAHVTAVSDPFPTILAGIPLQIRTIKVDLNRPDFTLNPTSCNPMSITGTLSSTGGLSAPVASRFQVGGCADLPFAPKLQIGLSGGKSQLTPGKHPTLTATYSQGPGQANTRAVKVALPLSLALDPNNSQHVCDHDQAAAVHGDTVPCPASTIVGTATAVTPLLPNPLKANVYLVQGLRTTSTGRVVKTLPTLLVPLRGPDGVALDLRAQSSVVANKLVTTFGSVPDAPVSKFVLDITGGSKGILTVTGSKSLCLQSKVATTQDDAQSGKRITPNVTLGTPCPRRTAARLKVRSVEAAGKRLTVAGRIAKTARNRITVTAACGQAHMSRKVRQHRGAWKATLALRGSCSKVRVTASYPGEPLHLSARASRVVRLR
jgi:hypothetical protein